MTSLTLCAYCRRRLAVNRDPVIPKALLRRLLKAGLDISAELLALEPACFECNVLKGTRKLVPPSWADKIPALKELLPGPWRTWDGNPMSPAFTQTFTRTP